MALGATVYSNHSSVTHACCNIPVYVKTPKAMQAQSFLRFPEIFLSKTVSARALTLLSERFR